MSNFFNQQRFSTPFFITRETFSAYKLHGGLNLSASLSFYAMFAMIPMALILFFVLSYLVVSSNHAVINLAIITSNFEPKLSRRIMTEVYKVAQHKTAWSAVGTFALLWFTIPLASGLRTAFYNIFAIAEPPSFLKKSIQDILAVIGILFVFFMFTFADLMLGKFLHFFHLAFAHSAVFEAASTLAIITLLLAAFYRLFFPIKISFNYILIGSLVTAILWMGMRPLFSEVFSANHSYGAIFGGMKNVFVSLAWLYYTFAIFLLGTELIATLHKRDILLLRGLFNETENGNQAFMDKLIGLYGISFKQGDTIFKDGEEGDDLYYVVSGKISLVRDGKLMRRLKQGDYFGEMAMLSDPIRIADAIVDSPVAEVIAISSEHIQALVLSEPKIAMRFLGHMALQLKNSRTGNNPA